MSYIRVIPRDLFNEANLLKCLGQLYICLENAGEHVAKFRVDCVEGNFDIRQNEADGSISVVNLPFSINNAPYILKRPMNSRRSFPLYASSLFNDHDDVEVFNEDGKLTEEFLELIKAK